MSGDQGDVGEPAGVGLLPVGQWAVGGGRDPVGAVQEEADQGGDAGRGGRGPR